MPALTVADGASVPKGGRSAQKSGGRSSGKGSKAGRLPPGTQPGGSGGQMQGGMILIDRNQLKLGRQLGEGEFGSVLKGRFTSDRKEVGWRQMVRRQLSCPKCIKFVSCVVQESSFIAWQSYEAVARLRIG